MSIALTGTGGCFTRLGLHVGEINRVASACFGTTLDNAAAGIFAQFASHDAQTVSSLFAYRDSVRASGTTYVGQLQQEAVAALVAQVDRDSPLVSQTAVPAVARLVEQMRGSGDSVQRAATSAVVTAGSANEGDAVVKVGLTDALGLPLDMVLAETLTAAVAADTGNGGATRYREPLQVVGQPTRPFSDYRWPAGSGGSVSLSVTDAADTSKNRLANGDFAAWSGTGSNTPGVWSLLAGAAGTQVLRGTSSPLRAADGTAYFCRFDSDGTTLTAVGQPVTLLPLTVYCVHFFLRIDGSDAQSFQAKLIDGTGATLANDAGTSLAVSQVLSGIGTNAWASVHAFWATPRLVPAGTRLSLGFTGTSPNAARVVDLALVSLVEATQAYPGGPFLAAFSKESQSAKGDTYALAVANNLTRWSFTRSLDGLLNLRANGLAFPSALSPTISDALIVSATP